MSVLAVLPARLGATRLPRKPLRLIDGVPIIVRVAQRVKSFAVADECVVATDSEEVLAACHSAGVSAVITRPDHPSGTDRVAEVAQRAEFAGASRILNVQGDEPFVARDAVIGALDMVRNYPLGTAAARADTDVLSRPDVVKVLCDDQQRAMYFSRAPVPFLRDAADASLLPPLVRAHIGVYAYTPEALAAWVKLPAHPLEMVERLEQLRPLANGIQIGVALVESTGFGGIDTEDDLLRARTHFQSLIQQLPGEFASPVHSPISSTI